MTQDWQWKLFEGTKILFRGNEILFRTKYYFEGTKYYFEGTKYYFEILFRGNEQKKSWTKYYFELFMFQPPQTCNIQTMSQKTCSVRRLTPWSIGNWLSQSNVISKLFRGNEIIFRGKRNIISSEGKKYYFGNEILFRGNEILFRGNEILFRGNEILFRKKKNLVPLGAPYNLDLLSIKWHSKNDILKLEP